MKLSQGDVLDLCDELAQKCYPKHVLDWVDKKGEERGGVFANALLGPPIEMNSEAEFAAHIRRTLFDRATVGARTGPGREVYYNRYSNTLIILTPNADKPGTCYRPDLRGTTLDRVLEKARPQNGGKRPYLHPGDGIFALHPELGRPLHNAKLPRAAKRQMLDAPRAADQTGRLSSGLIRELPPGLILPMGAEPIIVPQTISRPAMTVTSSEWIGLSAKFNAVRVGGRPQSTMALS